MRIMTGYTVHTGTSKKFISGWDRVFSGKTEGKKAENASRKPEKTKTKKSGKKK